MTITYYIDNATPDLVKTVILRKFFQMVFVGNDRKSLHIYTATIIGGHGDTVPGKKADTSGSTAYVSRLDILKDFRMKFEFVVRGNDNNDVISIESKNITADEHGFLSQIEYIRQVWGSECQVIQDDQQLLGKKLEKYLPSDNNSIRHKNPAEGSEYGCETAETAKAENNKSSVLKCWDITPSQTAALAGQKVLYIGDGKKKREGEMYGLAIAGRFHEENYFRPIGCKEKAAEGTERATYIIQVPVDVDLTPGIELVNWVKTTIRFRHQFHDSNMNFCIQKKGKAETDVQYIAPDFTWYFSPPVKAFIDNESSSVELKLVQDTHELSCERAFQKEKESSKSGSESVECSCPIKKMGVMNHTTTRYPNVINPVANKTTVNFKQWMEDEMISYRQKYRLAVKNIFNQNITFDNISEINIFLDTTDEHGRGNRQFILGLFISFALAFGIDSTRLEDAQFYFPLPKLLEADAWWLILLILLSLNILIRPPRAEKEHHYFLWRTVNVFFTLIWVVFVFIILRSQLVLNACSQWQSHIQLVLQVAYFVPVVSSLFYVLVNIIVYRDPIVSSLFHDDIL